MPIVPIGYPYNDHGRYRAAADASTLGELQLRKMDVGQIRPTALAG